MSVVHPTKHLLCKRCGVSINPAHARYLWIGYGERGASKLGKPGNVLFHRLREQSVVILCGPCGDQWRDVLRRFAALDLAVGGLDSFDRQDVLVD